MQQHDLHLPRRQRIAERHTDGGGFMPDVEVARARLVLQLLARERLPHRRPFGAGGGDHIVTAEVAERLEDGLTAILVVLHGPGYAAVAVAGIDQPRHLQMPAPMIEPSSFWV